MKRYTLYINFAESMIELPLPAMENRTFTIDMSYITPDLVLSFEVYDDIWKILSNGHCSISVSENSEIPAISEYTLFDGLKLNGKLGNNERFAIIVYEINEKVTTFIKYSLIDKTNLKIGRKSDSDICINDSYIGTEHAEIKKNGSEWYILDKSKNGTYINGIRIKGERMLKVYDTVYTVGFKMVFLGNTIAINRADAIKTNLKRSLDFGKTHENNEKENDYFSRSPRIIEPFFAEKIEIEAPPSPQKERHNPLIFVIGPSVTMPLPILMSTFINSQLGNASNGSAYIATIASVGMSALLGAGWAVAHQLYNKKTAKTDEKFRVEAYREYIDKNKQLLEEKHNYNSKILLDQYRSSTEIIDEFEKNDNFIWNRNLNHSDFLNVRVGKGAIKFQGDIAVPKQRFSLYKDEMAELPHELFDTYEYMKNAVSLASLRDTGILGVVGNAEQINSIIASVVVQIAALHCYTDVKIAAFFKDHENQQFGWIRWLPHCKANDSGLRMIANDEQSYKNVLYHVNSVLRSRYEKIENETGEQGGIIPHYIIICTSADIFAGDGIEKYLSKAEKLGVTFVLLYKKIDLLPNECKNIIRCDESFSGMYNLEDKRIESDQIDFDKISFESAEKFARKLSGYSVREYSTGEIPASVEYFDMIGIGNLGQWDLIKKYKENRVYEGMRSFIGIGTGGRPTYLDICEKRHGPHGLVAGTTGSGKSETLQTFIISLALNYHPDEIAFVLVDFKGGGMANAFIGMPHIAGTITNLDGDESGSGEVDESITRRALISVKSEKNRRQAIFNKYSISHIDDYIKLYREHKATEPLPHLIIILDEFAELKKEQPEFINELVSTARVGRSLGIHLILATQKPAGVVDDEIWSNSRFKLCLRVQDKQDSIGMLKRPEAAFLTNTGRAYLQIGNDEIFEQFQTGYSGAAYIPKEEVNAAMESDFAMINIDGTSAVSTAKIKKFGDNDTKKQSQLEAAIAFISDTCENAGIKPTRMLWMPVLPNCMALDDIKQPSPDGIGIRTVIGMVDDPENQRQFPAVVDITECSNLIIAGSAGMGKTTFLQTLLRSLVMNYSCEQLNFYILDFSSRTLKMLKNAPHCGSVAFSEDEESVMRLFDFINKSIRERKILFDSANVGSYQEYIRSRSLPMILVVIDNFMSFTDLYQNIQDDFLRISRDCVKYGIQIIITINNFSDIRSKVRQNFSDSITLVMNEKAEYRDAFNMPLEFLPRKNHGRGIIKIGGRLLEYQTALPIKGDDETIRNSALIEWVKQICERDADKKPAEKIRVIPKAQSYDEFWAENASDVYLPIGYYTSDISVYGLSLKETFCYAVSNVINKRPELVLNNILYAAKRSGAIIYTVRLNKAIKLNSELADRSFNDKEQLKELILDLKQEFHTRSNSRKKFLAENPDGDFAQHICDNYKKIFVVIDSMSEFVSQIYDPTNDGDYHSIPETIFKMGKGHAIYFAAGFDSQMYTGQGYYYAACKNFIAHGTGIHLGGCIDRQKLFATSMPMSKASKPAPPDQGFTVLNGDEYSIFIPGGENSDA